MCKKGKKKSMPNTNPKGDSVTTVRYQKRNTSQDLDAENLMPVQRQYKGGQLEFKSCLVLMDYESAVHQPRTKLALCLGLSFKRKKSCWQIKKSSRLIPGINTWSNFKVVERYRNSKPRNQPENWLLVTKTPVVSTGHPHHKQSQNYMLAVIS